MKRYSIIQYTANVENGWEHHTDKLQSKDSSLLPNASHLYFSLFVSYNLFDKIKLFSFLVPARILCIIQNNDITFFAMRPCAHIPRINKKLVKFNCYIDLFVCSLWNPTIWLINLSILIGRENRLTTTCKFSNSYSIRIWHECNDPVRFKISIAIACQSHRMTIINHRMQSDTIGSSDTINNHLNPSEWSMISIIIHHVGHFYYNKVYINYQHGYGWIHLKCYVYYLWFHLLTHLSFVLDFFILFFFFFLPQFLLEFII